MENLRRGPLTALELSQLIKVSEKDVVKHLPHVAKSTAHNLKLRITPARCEECGFAFSKRTRFTRPGRCPRCKSERIIPPAFSFAENKG
jgi:predicted Zn-ribbon and HTH transcriptional regulator